MPYSGLGLDGLVAFITGSGRGIGKAIALGFAKAGADVAVSDIPSRIDAAQEVQRQIQQLGRKSKAYTLDVREISSIGKVIDEVVSDFGHLDIQVNNAGIRVIKPALETTEEDWNDVLDVNLKGIFFCSQAAARHMIPRGSGRIINTASQLGQVARPNRPAYCASKAGVVNLTRALALEWIKSGITVNAIGPGPTETPFVEDNAQTPDQLRQYLNTYSPLGRRLDPEELVGAAIYLASPSASGTTGHLLVVDGGWTAW